MAFPTTNLYARYEALSETGYVDGDPLGTVVDQSGNSRDLTQATSSAQPTYQTAEINGEPVFRFDGVDDEARHDLAGSGLTSATALTITMVGNSGTGEDGSRSWPFSTHNSGPGADIYAFTEADSAGEWGGWARGNGETDRIWTTSVDTMVSTVLTLVWDGTTVSLYRDGSFVDSAAFAGPVDVDDIQMGNLQALSEWWAGDIALVAAWDIALDATARADLHSYVQDTYGITVSDYNGGGGTTESITGTSAGTSSDSAAATVYETVSITGTSAGTSSDTGVATTSTRQSITGTSAGTSSDTVTEIVLNLTGSSTSAGTSSDSGALSGTASLTATSAGTSSDSGSLTAASVNQQITGTSAGTSSDSATASGVGPVTASVSGTSAGTSTDSAVFVGFAALTGTSAGSSTDTANAALALVIGGGTSAGTSADTGVVQINFVEPKTVALVGQLSTTATLTGERDISKALTGSRITTTALNAEV